MKEDGFRWDDYFWVTEVNLDTWRVFGESSIELTFAPEGRDESPLKEEEIELVRWVIENEKPILDSLIDALLKEYPKIKEEYSGWMDEEEVVELLPEVETKEDLKKLISSPSINVHQILNKSAPFIGIQFNCSWDDEHALGILMYGSKVLEIGGADTAILLWMAEKHAKKT